jgi:hypothetical protein
MINKDSLKAFVIGFINLDNVRIFYEALTRAI